MSRDGVWHAWKDAGQAGQKQEWWQPGGIRSVASGAGSFSITAGCVAWRSGSAPQCPLSHLPSGESSADTT